MNFPWPKEVERLVREKLATGDYESEEDLIGRAMKALVYYEEELAALRDRIDRSRASLAKGERIPADQVFDRLEAKYRRMAAQR